MHLSNQRFKRTQTNNECKQKNRKAAWITVILEGFSLFHQKIATFKSLLMAKTNLFGGISIAFGHLDHLDTLSLILH